MAKRDYYEVLVVNKGATPDQIKSAYRKLAVKHHPDKNKGDKASEEKFKEASEAYHILSNEERKAIEDASANGRNALKGTDVEEIKKKTQDLVQASMKLGEAIYKSQQSTKPGDAPKDAKDEGKKDENVVDADFEEVKDDKEKSA